MFSSSPNSFHDQTAHGGRNNAKLLLGARAVVQAFRSAYDIVWLMRIKVDWCEMDT
jgi:hypothetical protein